MVGSAQVEAAEKQTQVVTVGCLHVPGRVICGDHHCFDQAAKDVEPTGVGIWLVEGGMHAGGGSRRRFSGREFIETDSRCLPQVHRRLLRFGGYLHEKVAVGQVFAGEPMFFRSEDDGDTTATGQMLVDDRGYGIQTDNRLFGLAVSKSAGAENEHAFADRVGDGCLYLRVLQDCGGPDGGLRFVPVRFIGGDDGETTETEVCHGSRHRADVERIARGDEHDGDAVAL